MSKSRREMGLRAWTQTQGRVQAAVWGRRPAAWCPGRRRGGAKLPGRWTSPGPCCAGSAVSGPGPSRCCPASGLPQLPWGPFLAYSVPLGLRWAWTLQSHTGSLFPPETAVGAGPHPVRAGDTRPRSRTLPGPRGLPRADQESPGEAVAQACRLRWDSASGWGATVRLRVNCGSVRRPLPGEAIP